MHDVPHCAAAQLCFCRAPAARGSLKSPKPLSVLCLQAIRRAMETRWTSFSCRAQYCPWEEGRCRGSSLSPLGEAYIALSWGPSSLQEDTEFWGLHCPCWCFLLSVNPC